MIDKHLDVKRDGDKPIKESKYDELCRTRDHHRCLWNDHGERCEKPATFLTTVLASKTIIEGDREGRGGHKSILKGGYCLYHWQIFKGQEPQSQPLPIKERDWRDDRLDAWLAEHADDPLVKRARLLAEGKGSAEDKSEHIRALANLARGIASRPLPYDKTRREEVS
jgi:hypothetical protein